MGGISWLLALSSQLLSRVYDNQGDRQKEWQKKLGITRQDVEELLKSPQQTVRGDRDVSIAQARRGNGLLRVPFIEEKGNRKVLTVYWTSRVEKYWVEE